MSNITFQKKLSIILPVYNVSQFLDDCIRSCLDQDLPEEDYEIICVNDGSTDNSLEKLNEYAKKYDNIKIITQKNTGLPGARNTGLNVAVGKYIWFIDSDDYIKKNCLKSIVDIMIEKDLDEYIFNYTGGEENYSELENLEKNPSFTHRDSCMVWMRVFSADVINKNNIRFENLKPAEDTLFTFEYGLCENPQKVLKTKDIIYYYRQRGGSITHSLNEKQRQNLMLLAEKYNDLLKKYNLSKKQIIEVKNRTGMAVAGVLFAAARYDNNLNILESLKDKGLYPYKFLWFTLIPESNFNHTISEYIKFLFPFEWYYKSVFKIFKLFK